MEYFIHTFELNQKISFEEYDILVHYFKCFRSNQESLKKLHGLVCTTYSKKGITLTLRSCTKNEKKRNRANLSHMLVVVVNPSKVLFEGCAVNHIHEKSRFKEALEILDQKLEIIFEKSGFSYNSLNDFTLQRVDITRDVDQIPKWISRELIIILKRMRLKRGFEIYEPCKYNGFSYASSNSCNIINESRGIEFVIYDKYDAARDQGCTPEERLHFRETVRIELRCKRRFIQKKKKKGDGVPELLLQFYRKGRDYVSEIYGSIFLDRTDLCYLSYPVAEKYINFKIPQPKRQEKMLLLASNMNSKSKINLEDKISESFNSSKTGNSVIGYFFTIGISPVVIYNKKIPYIQSLDSLLEFEPIEDIEYYISAFAQKKTRKKEVFLREGNE